MTRIIEYIGEEIEIDSYKEIHYLENQTLIKGIPINPCLRKYFDQTPNSEREDLEIDDWWNQPFIITTSLSERIETYESYLSRVTSFKDMQIDIESEEVFNIRMEEQKQNFLKNYPSGHCYIVRCLDGGAWDRSSWKGDFDSLEAALHHCNT